MDPMTIAGLASAGGALAGGLLSSNASKKAAQVQADSAREAMKIQQAQWNYARDDAAPWRDVGKGALYQLRDLTQPGGALTQPYTPGEYATDPGFKFGLETGQQAIDQSGAARGTLMSGKTLKDLMRYGTDYGTTKFNEGWQRDMAQKQFLQSMLAGLSGTGMTATANTGALGQQSANSISELLTGAGNAQASGIVGSANAMGQGISNAGNLYLQQSLLNRFLPQQTTPTATPSFASGMDAYTSPQSLNDLATYYGTY